MSLLHSLPDSLLPPLERLTAADRRDIEDILQAAVAWAGGMPIEEFAKVGWIIAPRSGRESAPYSRYLAMWDATKRHDPRLPVLRQAIDELIRFQGFVVTTHGVFAPGDIVDVVIRRAA